MKNATADLVVAKKYGSMECLWGCSVLFTKVKNVTADLVVTKKYGCSAIGEYHLGLDDMDKVTSICNDFMSVYIECHVQN